jgi:tetratricopeptide (TPR) repeat protein
VSLFLFLITTTLVYFFIYLISGRNLPVAILGALLFAVNAMRVESVAWAAERKDMLYSVFYMASLIAYVRYITGAKGSGMGLPLKFLALAFGFFILSVFSKVMAVSIVGPMVLLDYYYRRKLHLRLALEKIPFVAVSVVIGLVQVKATASAGTIGSVNMFTFFERIMIVSRNLMFYFYKILVPVNLSAYYPYPLRPGNGAWPVEFYIAPFFILALVILLIWSLRRTRIFLFSVGFFFTGIALVLQYVAVGPTMFSERYSLIPSVAFSFLLASGVHFLLTRFPGRRNMVYGAAGLYLACMFYLTYRRCDVWQSSLVLWNDAIAQFPYAPLPLNNRGRILGSEMGNTTQAMVDLSNSIRYDPGYPNAYSNRGIIYAMNGKFDSAIADFNASIRLQGDFYEAIVNRAVAYAQSGRPELALKDFTRCIELKPGNPEGYLNRGTCYTQLNQPARALLDFNLGMKQEPFNPEFYIRRAQALFMLGKYAEAYQDASSARDAGVAVDNAFFEKIRQAAGK